MRNADAGAEEIYTQASDGCENCGSAIRATKIKISGEDSRVDEYGKTRPEVKLTPAENSKFNGVGGFVCGSTGGSGTATLVKKGNGFIFVGPGHAVVPDDEKIYSEAQMKSRWRLTHLQ